MRTVMARLARPYRRLAPSNLLLCLLCALLSRLLLGGPTIAVAAPTESLPRPGECALWAGQARLLARRLLERATQAEQSAVARFYVETAYQLSPAPQLLYNLGLLRLRSGIPVEAADLLRRYQAQIGTELPSDHRAAIDKALQQVPKDSYEVELVATVGAVVFVDDRLVGKAPLGTPLLLSNGSHRLRIELGYRQAEAKVSELDFSDQNTAHAQRLRLRLPKAVVLIAPEFSLTQQQRLTTIFKEQGIALVPHHDRDLLLSRVADRTGCLTQTICQLWLGEQLDVEQVMVMRSIDLVRAENERLSRLSLEVLSVPHGAQLLHRQTICPDCSPSRSEPYLHALARTVRRELPDLTATGAATMDEPAPIGFEDAAPSSLSPCALARGTARRLARRLLQDISKVQGDDEARVRIETAFQLSPSPILLYNLGLLYRRMGSTLVGADLLGRFLATGGMEVTAERRAKVEAALAEPHEPSAQVLLTGPPGALVLVDGQLHGTLPLESPLSVAPGTHRLLIEIGYRMSTYELSLRAGEQRPLTTTLPDAVLLLPDEKIMSTHPELLTVSQRAAEEAGLTVIPERDRELIVHSLPEYENCERSLLCMRRVGKMLGAQSVLRLERRNSGLWAGRMVDSDDGALSSLTSESCKNCPSDDLAIRWVVKQLALRRHAPRAKTTLDAEPRALLSLDGFGVGEAPQPLLLTDGTYQLTATFADTRSVTQRLRVPTDLHLTLRLPVAPSRRKRIVPAAIGLSLLAGGTILLATGIGLWGAENRPGAMPPAPWEPANGPITPVAGPVLLVTGAASALAGGLILGRLGLSGLRELRSR